MKTPRIDNSGSAAATQALADATTASNNLKKNFGADLATENLTQAIAGGSAENASLNSESVRRRRQGSGLSSQLGINV